MNTIKPPVSLANSDSEHRVDYIQNVGSQLDYEITPVSILPLCLYCTLLLFLTTHVNSVCHGSCYLSLFDGILCLLVNRIYLENVH